MNFDVSKEQNQIYKWRTRKTFLTFGIVLFAIFAVAGINAAFNNPDLSAESRVSNGIFALVSVLLLGACVFGRVYAVKTIGANSEIIGQKENELIQAYSQTSLSALPTVDFPPDVIPSKGEFCVWAAPATYYENKTVTTGYRSQSSGISVGIAPGIRLHSGSSVSTPIKKTVLSSYAGRILVTNKRLVYLSSKGGFDKSLKSISSISNDPYALLLQMEGKTERINTQNSFVACQVIRLAVKEAKQN